MNATVVLFLSWFVLFWLFAGVGLLLRKAFRQTGLDTAGLFLAFWIGWGVSIALLQIWHLLLPVQVSVWYLLVAASTAGLVWCRRELLSWGRGLWSPERWRSTIGWSVVLVIVGVLVADFAIGPLSYDTGLYHLSTVGWQTEYPVVPGLANLHFRLGFNSSSLLYYALLETGPWTGISQHVGGGLLAMSMMGGGLLGLRTLRARHAASHFGFLAVGAVPAFIGAGEDSAGMSTDSPAFALAMVLGYLFLRVRAVSPNRASEAKYLFVVTVFLASVAVSVKPSVAVYAFIVVLLVARNWYRGKPPARSRRFSMVVALGAAAAVLVPWLARGFILSGYPLFPVAMGGLPVDWSVPRSFVSSEQAITVWWARWAGTSLDTSGGLAWLQPWLRYTLPRVHAFALPLGLAAVGLGMLVRVKKRTGQIPRPEILEIGALLLPIAFWFATVPTLRFVQGPIWSAGAISIVIGMDRLARSGLAKYDIERAKQWFAYSLAVGGLLLTIGYLNQPAGGSTFPAIPVASTELMVTNSGLAVQALPDPSREDRLYASKNLSTPYFNPDLRLRVTGDVGSGFSVVPDTP